MSFLLTSSCFCFYWVLLSFLIFSFSWFSSQPKANIQYFFSLLFFFFCFFFLFKAEKNLFSNFEKVSGMLLSIPSHGHDLSALELHGTLRANSLHILVLCFQLISMFWFYLNQSVMPRPTGYGGTIVTYIRRADIPSHTYAKHISTCRNQSTKA